MTLWLPSAGFDSDESGGLRMVPLARRRTGGSNGGDGSSDGGLRGGSCGREAAAAAGLSPASSDSGGSGGGNGHLRLPVEAEPQRPGARVGFDGAVRPISSGSMASPPLLWKAAAPAGSGGLDFGSADEMSPRVLRADLRPLEGVAA